MTIIGKPIILCYGPPQQRAHEDLWLPMANDSIRISEYWPAHIQPGAYDLMALATLLLKAYGVIEIPGKIGKGGADGAPFWDAEIKDGKLTGAPLDEGLSASEPCRQLMAKIWKIREKTRIQAVVIDRLMQWQARLVLQLAKLGHDQDTTRALRDRLVTDSLWWLSRSVPVILVTGAEWLGPDREYRVPHASADISALADVVLFVEGERVLVESVRKEPLFKIGVVGGAKLSTKELYKSLGLLAEANMEETTNATS